MYADALISFSKFYRKNNTSVIFEKICYQSSNQMFIVDYYNINNYKIANTHRIINNSQFFKSFQRNDL